MKWGSVVSAVTLMNMTILVAVAFTAFGCGLILAAPWNGQAQFARAVRSKFRNR